MRYLELDEILVLHAFQLEKFGGGPDIRDVRLLESAVMRPQATFSGKNLYEDVFSKAAVLALGIIQNHPFVDGNKRTGIHSMLVFLEINGIKTKITSKELVAIGNGIVTKELTVKKLARLLKESSQRPPPSEGRHS